MDAWDMEEFLDDLEMRESTTEQEADGDEDITSNDLYVAGEGYLFSREEEMIRRFLGGGRVSHVPLDVARYYGGLLSWALERTVEKEQWQVCETLGIGTRPPSYERVHTAPGKWENLLTCGIMLLARRGRRLVISIDHGMHEGSVVALSPRNDEGSGRRFVRGLERVMQRENIYRGHKIQFGPTLRFLELTNRDWSDLTLPKGVKEVVLSHTVTFLKHSKQLAEYGIPPRRGLLLTGKPGTGKTLLCKVLMNHSPGISCIVAHASGLQYGAYIDDVYKVAGDISPSIVILEDIDLIGQDRHASMYSRSESLAQLLFHLDGVEECRNVVTVATTNCVDVLDEALKDRPSRFDRIVSFEPPDLEERRAYIEYLARHIPIPVTTRERLVTMSEGLTPAQIQEVVHGVVIEACTAADNPPDWEAVFSPKAVDAAVATVRRKPGVIGFAC